MEGRWRRSFPPGHIAFASILVERGLIAQASCDLLHALHSINEGVAIADASVRAGRQGADRLPAMLTSRSEVELLLHRNNDAEADAARAVAILQQSIGPGGFSGHLGRAYLALGRARLAQDKREEAQSAFRSAAEQLDQAVGADHPDSRAARALIASFK
jgi:tetratricopeptide (TPR) repeat protein